MIILKQLTVERFRLLQEIHLHFPQRGSILIHGPNEAGKSTLLESIYFALYGEPLASRASLDDLVSYGETQANVILTLSIGVTELTIKRVIVRGGGQSVTLSIRRLGMPEELIARVSEANARIIAELGRMDGEALRNSCLIEQKGLDRLENLSSSQREATLRKLLGLEKLMRLSEQFKLTEHDEQLLDECRRRLQLAEVQARIPELSMQLGQIEAALDAVTVSEDLAEIEQQEAESAEQAVSLEQLATKRSEIQGRQNRIAQLKKADTILGEIIDAYDALAEAQRELPELERQIADLERRERDELPALENLVHELSELTSSFGTLERMAADLLAAVNTIKTLEQELKAQENVQEDLSELDEQIIAARLQVEQALQSQHELEEQGRAGRPQLEARLQRLQALAARLKALSEAEEHYAERRMHQGLEEENSAQLQKVQQELQETETELALVENEARQLQQQADAIENHWRQVNIARQLEEWQRLKGISQGLVDTEEHVKAAQAQQEQLGLLAESFRRAVTKNMGIAIAFTVLFLLCGSAALLLALHQAYVYATIAGMATLLLAAGAGLSLQNYGKSREEEKVADAQVQDAISRVRMMVTAREAAGRAWGGNSDATVGGVRLTAPHDTLAQIEHELQSLGGTVPHSLEEASYLLQELGHSALGHYESLADLQQQMIESRNNALAARNQVNVTMEAVAALRKERTRLEEQRKHEGWNNLQEQLLADFAAIEQMRHEIISSVGEEGLTIPDFEPHASDDVILSEAKDPALSRAHTQLKMQIEDAIKSAEREIAALDGKLDLLPELKAQTSLHQQTLNVLLARKQAVGARLAPEDITSRLESARQQQEALRDALRNLQDRLRQRTQHLGVSFGQAAVSSAEAAARNQLAALHITLGQRLELSNRHTAYTAQLRERQEALSTCYAQLAKLSATLGGWIVPPNPFAETLLALRGRCQQEVREADEEATVRELRALEIQEGASRAKIALCQADIEAAQERIATMLAQRSRPPAKGYHLTDIVAVWPLVGEYAPRDRERLQAESVMLEQNLHELEQQEVALSEQLSTGTTRLDLAQTRKRMEQQERTYSTKKRGSLLLQAVHDRLMQKMLPRTEYYMQQLLPSLTSGRFHDTRLVTDPTEAGGADLSRPTPQRSEAERVSIFRPGDDVPAHGAWQIEVWEAAARNYIPKSILSAGTSDALALTLRLAFAIAALPRELGAAPGFLLLDDPLDAVDGERARALIEVVTGSLLSEHFEQVIFVSHSSVPYYPPDAIPARFAYQVAIEAGRVVQSNLPLPPPVVESVILSEAKDQAVRGTVLSAVLHL